jgi:hypothetical protein
MKTKIDGKSGGLDDLERYPLLAALRDRRSRRFGLGMKIPSGPLAYESRHAARPLSDDEEAALVFAACGITGYALADLAYAREEGGNIMAGLVGRTIASGDALQTVALVLINDTGTHLVQRPRELPAREVADLIALGQRGEFTQAYRRSRAKLDDKRLSPPMAPPMNLNVNRWSLHARGTSYFLPVNDLTVMYLNGLLEIFNEETGVFVLDERNGYRPAGLAKFARTRGGHLEDDPRHGRVVTVRHVEQLVTEFVSVEQGMMLQNLGLMTQALGLGGFPHFANHEFAWFQAMGFRMESMPASRYLGVGPLVALGMKCLKRDLPVPYPIGLEREGRVLLRPFCPPYFATMRDAVHAVVELKFGANGIFRGPGHGSAWSNHPETVGAIPRVSDAAVAATTAYCEYLWGRYGRFPVYLPPFKTVLGFQACHLDAEFYDRFYRPEALAESQRRGWERSPEGRKE